MARHSKHERERRTAETERVKQIEAAWLGSLPPAAAKAFCRVGRRRPRPWSAGEAARTWRPAPRPVRRGPATSPSRPRTSGRAGRATATDLRLGLGAVAANDYHFITTWRIAATPEEITAVLGDAEGLARWWPSVYLQVRVLEPGDANGHGKVVDLWTKGFLPYTLRWRFKVTESDPPTGFRLDAEGDFVGRGIWTLRTELDGGPAGRSPDDRRLRLADRRREGHPQASVTDHEAGLRGQPSLGDGPGRTKPSAGAGTPSRRRGRDHRGGHPGAARADLSPQPATAAGLARRGRDQPATARTSTDRPSGAAGEAPSMRRAWAGRPAPPARSTGRWSRCRTPRRRGRTSSC